MNENSRLLQCTVKAAKICEVFVENKSKPVFRISVQTGDDSCYEISKEYKHFFQLQCSILEQFPTEAGKDGYYRVIPFLPGRKIFRKDDLSLAEERMPGLNQYMAELLKLNENISQSKLVLNFFSRQDVIGNDLFDNTNTKKLDGQNVNEEKLGSITMLWDHKD